MSEKRRDLGQITTYFRHFFSQHFSVLLEQVGDVICGENQLETRVRICFYKKFYWLQDVHLSYSRKTVEIGYCETHLKIQITRVSVLSFTLEDVTLQVSDENLASTALGFLNDGIAHCVVLFGD